MQAAVIALLVIAVIAALGGAVGNGSILLDDPEYVFSNPHVLAGFTWDGFVWSFCGVHGGNWHPLTSLSHMLDVELFGTAPAGHHAVSVALHALASVLAFVALQRLTRATWASFAAALLFAVHPLRVESVAWIAERKDVLSGVFFWLAVLAYTRWVERPTARRYMLLVAVYALGLLSKPMLVTLPFVLLLLDVWPLARLGPGNDAGWSFGPRLREKIPLFGLGALSCVVTFLVQRGHGAMLTAESIPLAQRFANAPVAVVTYLRKTVWPADLAPYYPFDLRDSLLVPLACAVGIAVTIGMAWRQLRERPWIAIGSLWFLGMLVPVIGIVQVGGQALADRYTYLPSVGLALVVAFGARAAIERSPSLRWLLIVALAVTVAAMGLTTRAQTSYWHDTRTLAAHTLAINERNAFAHQMYANAVIEGDPAAARAHLQAALNLVPPLRGAHNGLGYLLAREKRFEEAVTEYQAELAIHPTAQVYYNLGLSLSRIGRANEAIPVLEQGLDLDPQHRPSLVRLGIALALTGRIPEATRRFESALELEPGDVDALRGLAAVQAMAGNTEAAVASYERLLALTPEDTEALLEAAWIRATHREARVRDAARAQHFTDRARQLLHGENAALLCTLAVFHADAAQFGAAIAEVQRANELARAAGDSAMVERTVRQLDAYQAGKPFRP